MKEIYLESLDMEETLFHFDVRNIEFINKYGFPADIGPDSKNAEKTPKVFFSKGIKGALYIIDVWLIWRINKDNEYKLNWSKEFLSGSYLNNEKLQLHTFKNMYEWLKNRKYYKLDLIEGIDYLETDIDEAKQSALQDLKENKSIPWRYLFFYEMYKDKIEYKDSTVEKWNMHTKKEQGVPPDKIMLIKSKNNNTDALSIILEIYEQYENKQEFRLLNAFIRYCKNMSIGEQKDGNIRRI